METKLNIYQRINEVMKEQIYVKKGSAGQGTGVGYDDLIVVLSPLLIKHGIVVTAEKTGDSSDRETKKGVYIFQSDFNVSYINIDNPDDRFTTLIEAHAMDAGDKAPGKAITYATKTSMLKVFSVESGDNEESRIKDIMEASKKATMTRTQLTKYIQDKGYTTDQVEKGMNQNTGRTESFGKMSIPDIYDMVTFWSQQN